MNIPVSVQIMICNKKIAILFKFITLSISLMSELVTTIRMLTIKCISKTSFKFKIFHLMIFKIIKLI
jgi:hypothetical protein